MGVPLLWVEVAVFAGDGVDFDIKVVVVIGVGEDHPPRRTRLMARRMWDADETKVIEFICDLATLATLARGRWGDLSEGATLATLVQHACCCAGVLCADACEREVFDCVLLLRMSD